MEMFALDLANGVVGGLIATFLTLVVHRVWINVIQPWYEERVYQDAHFEGRWTATEVFSDTDPPQTGTFTIDFKRQGHRVTGTSRCTAGPDKDKVYLMEGSFKNLILTLTWIPEDSRSLERGALAMKLVENGTKLIGHGVFYSPATEQVHTSVFEGAAQGN